MLQYWEIMSHRCVTSRITVHSKAEGSFTSLFMVDLGQKKRRLGDWREGDGSGL